MRSPLPALALLLSTLLATAPSATAQDAAQDPAQDATQGEESTQARCQRQAGAAYAAGDFATFLRAARCLEAERPGHPRLLYNLACGQSLTGDARGALATLGRLADMGLVYDLATDGDFDPIRQRRGFRRLERRMERLRQPHGTAVRRLVLDDPELAGGRFVPEGIAGDPANGDLYLSSVHRRRIVRAPRAGEPELLASALDGLGAVFGLAVDPERRRLWACTADIPQMEGFDPAAEPRADLVRFDLDTAGKARLAARYPVPESPDGRTCNDLTVAADGGVFVADSLGGAVYRLAAGAAALEPLVPPDAGLRSPNGLALSADGRRLYVADYPGGLFAVDLPSAEVHLLTHPPDATLRGIDGLVRHGDTLLAVQNGVAPHRVLRLHLAADGLTIRRVDTLLASHPDFDEPTLATLAAGRLLVVANSHWNRFAEDHTLPSGLAPPIVLELAVE